MRCEWDDGGRAAAGYRGRAGDCGCRALAIACRVPYQVAYDMINAAARAERPGRTRRRSSARDGCWPAAMRRALAGRGQWVATMGIGTGCRVHLTDGELPMGRLIVRVSKHWVAVIDGVIHDTADPSRGGTRCVYGYYVVEG